MADLYHFWGGDIALSATGDLLLVEGSEMGRQRVMRRLLSNAATEDAPGDLLFDPEYGAGLPRRVGSTNSVGTLEAVSRRQMFMEEAVSQEPPPVIRVTKTFGGASIKISYVDAQTSGAASVGFDVER